MSLLKVCLYVLEKTIFCILYKSKIAKYKNKHIGKRCFIIGNGPSLTAEDLDLIDGEYSFAANSIFKIFGKTKWRPSYYLVQDAEYAKGIVSSIPSVTALQRFISINVMLKNRYYNRHDIGFYLDRSNVDEPPNFSNDMSRCSYEGFTVLYSAMQLASYMGFKEIYLLGVDFNYTTHKDNQGSIIKSEGVVANHFFESQGKQVIGPLPNLIYSKLAYEQAERYSREHGVRIYNCTRGGKLEVFERKLLEEVVASEN